jgi:hypothetical protein
VRVLVVTRLGDFQHQLTAMATAFGHDVIVPALHEPVVDALERGQCGIAVIDCDDRDCVRAALSAQSFGAQVILCGSIGGANQIEQSAAALTERCFSLPELTADRFGTLLTRAAEAWIMSRAIRFTDRRGQRWYVREVRTSILGHVTPSLEFVHPWQPNGGGHYARRVWAFPTNWRQCHASELEALCEGPAGRPEAR